jgi:hypothetical protein
MSAELEELNKRITELEDKLVKKSIQKPAVSSAFPPRPSIFSTFGPSNRKPNAVVDSILEQTAKGRTVTFTQNANDVKIEVLAKIDGVMTESSQIVSAKELVESNLPGPVLARAIHKAGFQLDEYTLEEHTGSDLT